MARRKEPGRVWGMARIPALQPIAEIWIMEKLGEISQRSESKG